MPPAPQPPQQQPPPQAVALFPGPPGCAGPPNGEHPDIVSDVEQCSMPSSRFALYLVGPDLNSNIFCQQ